MRTKTLPALIVALFLLVSALPVALAEDADEDERGEKAREMKDERRGEKEEDDSDDDDDDDHRGKPRFERKGDHYLFHNDQIAVWFKEARNGKAAPDVRVLVNGTDGNVSGYRVKLLRLYEAEDGLQFRGSYNKMNLAKRDDWNVQTTQTNESLTLTMVRAESQGILTLTWHINKTSAEVKFDVGVTNWAWKADHANHTLVLDMLVLGKNLRNETGARVSVEDAGYIAWETTASASYADGTTQTLNVTAHQKRTDSDDDDEEDDDEGHGAHLLLAFEGEPGYTGLEYDPTFGVQSSTVKSTSVPGFAPALVGVGVLVAVALFGRRK